jgi:hypothetical protein
VGGVNWGVVGAVPDAQYAAVNALKTGEAGDTEFWVPSILGETVLSSHTVHHFVHWHHRAGVEMG